MLDTTDNHTMDIDSLLDFLRKYQKEGNKVREMATYASLGHTYMSSSRYQEAVLSHEKELELAQELNDTLMMATALNDLGTNYRRMSLYYDALEYHSRAIEVATPASGINKQKLMKCQAVGNNGLGNIYMKIGNYARADSALRRALAIETALGSHLGMNVDNSNIGMVFERLGMYDSALIYFQRAYEHSKLSGSQTGLAYCHMHFGRIYQHNKEYDKALNEFHEAMDVINEDIDKWLWL
jgi:tetratricopeptide (TPR) repeat protein